MHSLVDYLVCTIQQTSIDADILGLHVLLDKFITLSATNMDVLIFALIYFQLFTIRNGSRADYEHFVACVLIASKFIGGKRKSIKNYANITLLSTYRLVDLEREILKKLDYHLNVPEDIYDSTCKYLHKSLHQK